MWNKIAQFDAARGSWSAWLTAVTRNTALNFQRSAARLGQNDRALFYRKYYYLQSTAQIAAELGMTERAVEGRLYRLKKRLRTMLGGDGDA